MFRSGTIGRCVSALRREVRKLQYRCSLSTFECSTTRVSEQRLCVCVCTCYGLMMNNARWGFHNEAVMEECRQFEKIGQMDRHMSQPKAQLDSKPV